MTLRAIDILSNGAPWSIMPEMMGVIESIINRETSPEAVAKELGRPLQNARSVEMRGNTAIIPVSGPIFPKANLFTEISGATSIEMLALDFNKALNDPAVASIILDIDSPGGQVNGINEFAGMVRDSSKKVVAYIGGTSASAAYWITSACDEVVCEATALVGNIGVVVGYSVEKDESRRELVSSRAPDKRPNMTTEQGLAVVQVQIDAVEDVFLNTVADGRGMTVDALAEIRGQVLVGQAAVDAGLADKLGSLESVIAGLSGVVSTKGGQMATNDKNKPVASSAALVLESTALTVDGLKADYPEVYQSVFNAGVGSVDVAASEVAGATAERERIEAVGEQSIAGHEALIKTLQFDGKTTGGEAAIAVLKAEKEGRQSALEGLQGRQKPLADIPSPTASTESPKDLAAQATVMVAQAKENGITMSVAQAMNKIKKGEE